jgi:hypothetical protein
MALLAPAFAAALLGFASPATAAVLVTVDKSTQHMTVEVDGQPRYDWPVSTGAPGYDTPSGSFKAFRMEADHFSKEWDDAPMPHSIFFTTEGHAIHGSYAKTIGQPASHGCVRLAPQNAATLFKLVKEQGVLNTRVVLTGVTPGSSAAPLVSKRRQPYDDGGYAQFDDSRYRAEGTVGRSARDDDYYNGSTDGYGRGYAPGGYYQPQPYYGTAQPQPYYAPPQPAYPRW